MLKKETQSNVLFSIPNELCSSNKVSEGKTEQRQYLARPLSQGLSRAVPLKIQRRCVMTKERHMHFQKKGQKVNLKNYRQIGLTLMVPRKMIKHGFA